MDDRKHLTALEVDKLMAATKGSRNEARDRCLLLLMFRHGLRVWEACGLGLSQVDTESRVLHAARLKKGLSTTPATLADKKSVRSGLIFARSTSHALMAKLKDKIDNLSARKDSAASFDAPL